MDTLLMLQIIVGYLENIQKLEIDDSIKVEISIDVLKENIKFMKEYIKQKAESNAPIEG